MSQEPRAAHPVLVAAVRRRGSAPLLQLLLLVMLVFLCLVLLHAIAASVTSRLLCHTCAQRACSPQTLSPGQHLTGHWWVSRHTALSPIPPWQLYGHRTITWNNLVSRQLGLKCLTTGSASAAASRRDAHSVFFEMRSTRRCAFAASSAAHSLCVSALACPAQLAQESIHT